LKNGFYITNLELGNHLKLFCHAADLDLVVSHAVVLNETAACYNNYGRQSLFYKIQAPLQGTMLLRTSCVYLFANWMDCVIHLVLFL